MPYDEFKGHVVKAIQGAGRPLTWTEIRTMAGLPQLFPNNQWVHRLEKDIGLHRHRAGDGIIHWELEKDSRVDVLKPQATKTTDKGSAPPDRK